MIRRLFDWVERQPRPWDFVITYVLCVGWLVGTYFGVKALLYWVVS